MKLATNFDHADKGLIILRGEGEFDTLYCPLFMGEVESLSRRESPPRAIGYDLARVTFLNSTGLGAIIKATKELAGINPAIRGFLVNPTSDFVYGVANGAGILDPTGSQVSGKIIAYRTIEQALRDLSL